MQGRVKKSGVDHSLTNLYILLMLVGFFNGNSLYMSLGKYDICANEHAELAADAARQGIVLLKNDKNALPLSIDTYKNLAVVGPHANATKAMLGNYADTPWRYTSPIDGSQSSDQRHLTQASRCTSIDGEVILLPTTCKLARYFCILDLFV